MITNLYPNQGYFDNKYKSHKQVRTIVFKNTKHHQKNPQNNKSPEMNNKENVCNWCSYMPGTNAELVR